jgi:hypothetical protein
VRVGRFCFFSWKLVNLCEFCLDGVDFLVRFAN